MALGPGLRAASMTFDRGIVVVDLSARRLTRIPMPPNRPFASEVRAGPGWIVTLGYGQNQRSTVRSTRYIDCYYGLGTGVHWTIASGVTA